MICTICSIANPLTNRAIMQLGYRPFLDPLNLHDHWFWTLIPLLLLTAMAYKGIRLADFKPKRWMVQSAVMTVQLIILMAGLAIGLHLIVELFLPALG